MICMQHIQTPVLGALLNAVVSEAMHGEADTESWWASLLPPQCPQPPQVWRQCGRHVLLFGCSSWRREGGHIVRVVAGPAASRGKLFSWVLIRDVCSHVACVWGRHGEVVAKSGGDSNRCESERAVRAKQHWPLSIAINERCWGRQAKHCLQSLLASSGS